MGLKVTLPSVKGETGKLTRNLLQLCVWLWCLGFLARRRKGTQWVQFQARLAGIIPTSRWGQDDNIEVQIRFNSWSAWKGDSRELIFLPGPEPRILCGSRGRVPGCKSLTSKMSKNVMETFIDFFGKWNHLKKNFLTNMDPNFQSWKLYQGCKHRKLKR